MATISKADIGTGNTIQSEHITRIIDALNGTGSADVIATGSFTGSFNGFADTWTVQDLTVFGTASINYFETIYETSSIIFQSGSTKFGNSADDTHQFTGSVFIDGDTQILGNTTATGSFSGSFVGDGSGLDGVVATTLFALSAGSGISAFTFDGSSTQTINVSGSTALSADTVTKWTGDAFADTNITDNGVVVDINSNTTITGSLNVTGGITGSYTGSFVGDGSGLTGISVPSGVFGIANASGSYTYYSDFNSALTAASSGDTVELFADVTETTDTTVNMKNGVNVNFNGHTYTLNTSGTTNCISVGSGVTVELFNGKLVRTGGTPSNSNSLAVAVGTGGLLRNFGMYYYNDFGTAGYVTSSGLRIIGGHFQGETIGLYVNGCTAEKVYARGNTSYGIQIQNGGQLYYSEGYSRDNYGIFNNNSRAYSCVGKSDGNNGFQATGDNFNCTGYSSASTGLNCTGNFANIFGYSTALYGVVVIADGNGVTGYSTANNGVRISSGGGTSYKISNLNAHSTAAIALYLFLNAGKFEISNINVFTDWNDVNGHGVQVLGTDNDIYVSGGNINVLNSSANCLYNNTAKSFYFANLSFMNSTTPINANITNLQSNTPDAYGNILIG